MPFQGALKKALSAVCKDLTTASKSRKLLCMQATVDAAIKQLSDLKVVLAEKIKVEQCSWQPCSWAPLLLHHGIQHASGWQTIAACSSCWSRAWITAWNRHIRDVCDGRACSRAAGNSRIERQCCGQPGRVPGPSGASFNTSVIEADL